MNDISHIVDAANSPCISYDRQIFDPVSKLWRYVEADPPSGSRWELGGPNSLGSPVTTRSVPGSVIATPSLPTPAAMHAAAAKRKPSSRLEVAAAARAIARRHRMVSHMHTHNGHERNTGHGHNNLHNNHGHHNGHGHIRRPWSPAQARPRTPVRASSGTIPTRKLSTYSEDGTILSGTATRHRNNNRGSYAKRTTSSHNYMDDNSYGHNGGRRIGFNSYDRRQFSNYSEDGSMLFSASASTAVANSSSQRHGQRQLSGFIR